MEIVKTTIENWEDLKKIRIDSLKDSPNAFGAKLEDALMSSDYEWKNASETKGNLIFFLAYEAALPIGMVGFIRSNELISMWVAPKFRGKGVASKLVQTIKDYSITIGCNKVILKVEQKNKGVINFYLKCGFNIEHGDNNVMYWQP